jgi:hypothetical protein
MSQAAEARSESPAQAQKALTAMLHAAGIARLYQDLAATVLAESHLARQVCEDSTANADNIRHFVSQALSVDQLMEASVEQLSHLIEQSMIDEVAHWMTSVAGRQILEAEAQSADWSADEFERRELALASDPDWNDARQRLILHVLDATATVPFVTALHSETSALVLQAGDCIASDASRPLINRRIQQARNEEAFYSVFLRNDMLTTAAMIFSDISDADLDTYVRYSQSAAGRAWNQALLETIRQVLRDRHAPMQRFLAAIPHE